MTRRAGVAGTGTMRQAGWAALLLFLGVITVQLVRTQAYLRYVKPGLAPWLLLTGGALALLGAAGLFAACQPQRPQLSDDGGQDDDGTDGVGRAAPGSRAGVLLLVPIGLLVLVSPPALGSYGLQGQATRIQAAQDPTLSLPPPRAGAVELTLREYGQRALFQAPTLTGARLRLVGFAVPATTTEAARHGAGFYLTRIALSCCAADGTPVRVFVRTPPPQRQPEPDTWWQVEGAAPPAGSSAATPPGGNAGGSATQPDVVLEAAQLTTIPAPANPYTH